MCTADCQRTKSLSPAGPGGRLSKRMGSMANRKDQKPAEPEKEQGKDPQGEKPGPTGYPLVGF